MSYEPASLFSPAGHPVVVSQVAALPAQEVKFEIQAVNSSVEFAHSSILNSISHWVIIGGILVAGYFAIRAIAETPGYRNN